MSLRSFIAGALGAATAAGDLAGPGLSPIVDLASGAAVAWLAWDGVCGAAAEAGLDVDRKELAAAALSEAGDSGTVASRILHACVKGPPSIDLASAAWRAAWRHLLSAGLAKMTPGLATAVNVAGAARVAARNASFVSSMEERAAAICASVTPFHLPADQASVSPKNDSVRRQWRSAPAAS